MLFADYPFLRILLYSKWFRAMTTLFVLFALTLGLCGLKIWRTSPDGFLPIVRVSLIDFVQVSSLRHAALKAAFVGKHDQSLHAWQAALSNNPADASLVRGLLNEVLKAPKVVKLPAYAVGQTSWLLRLTRTNQADVELVARVYERFSLNEYLLLLFQHCDPGSSLPLRKIQLKALFNAGYTEELAKLWNHTRQVWEHDPELGLYRAAYELGWGRSDNVAAGRAVLAAAQNDPALRKLACRLELAVSAHLADPNRYERFLNRLKEWSADTLADHAQYWHLLLLTGRKEEAVRQAQAYVIPPQSALETVRLAEEYAALGLHEEAHRIAQKNLAEFGWFTKLWQLEAALLIDDQQWEGLLGVALRMRQEPSLRGRLAGFSRFLEGRAQLGQARRTSAEASFKQATELEFEDGTLGLAVASELNQLGYPALALDLLCNLEDKLNPYLRYWDLVFQTAFASRQAGPLLKAASKTFSLKPNDLVIMNNYAATLITLRVRPEEAVKLTVQLAALRPKSLATRINHALALLLNQRVSEAETILDSVPESRLSPLEVTAYQMARFQAHLAQRQYERARSAAALIDPQFLFPNEIEWLQTAREQLLASFAAQTARRNDSM